MSKQVPIAISWFFNGNLIWHFSNEAKTEEMVTQNRLLLQKMQKNAPKMAQTLYLKSGNERLRICPWCMTTLDCLCGTLVVKTELKCTKKFKALYCNLTKCNGTGFWRFGTDMFYSSKEWASQWRGASKALCYVTFFLCSKSFPPPRMRIEFFRKNLSLVERGPY